MALYPGNCLRDAQNQNERMSNGSNDNNISPFIHEENDNTIMNLKQKCLGNMEIPRIIYMSSTIAYSKVELEFMWMNMNEKVIVLVESWYPNNHCRSPNNYCHAIKWDSKKLIDKADHDTWSMSHIVSTFLMCKIINTSKEDCSKMISETVGKISCAQKPASNDKTVSTKIDSTSNIGKSDNRVFVSLKSFTLYLKYNLCFVFVQYIPLIIFFYAIKG